jgi:uncharacterized membrane protein HdeD (DUF308 family)
MTIMDYIYLITDGCLLVFGIIILKKYYKQNDTSMMVVGILMLCAGIYSVYSVFVFR